MIWHLNDTKYFFLQRFSSPALSLIRWKMRTKSKATYRWRIKKCSQFRSWVGASFITNARINCELMLRWVCRTQSNPIDDVCTSSRTCNFCVHHENRNKPRECKKIRLARIEKKLGANITFVTILLWLKVFLSVFSLLNWKLHFVQLNCHDNSLR